MRRIKSTSMLAGTAALLFCCGWMAACNGGGDSCPPGAEGCPCTGAGICNGGLNCLDGYCQNMSCPAGQQGCACTPQGTCEPSLLCQGNVCLPATGCSATPQSIVGNFVNNVSPITFNDATVNITHKRDVDVFEDGCITAVDISLFYGTGCQLRLTAGGRLETEGLAIQSVTFSADSQCPGYADPAEGQYVGTDLLTLAYVDIGVSVVPGDNVESACVAATILVKLGGTLTRSSPPGQLIITPSTISITGYFPSVGNYSSSCPTVCGNGLCDPGETRVNCGTDCAVCGDGFCDSNEASICPADCGNCGNGTCEVGETRQGCPADCAACGDGYCDSNETRTSCPSDCSVCGDNYCDSPESETSCPSDCGVCDTPADLVNQVGCSFDVCGIDEWNNIDCVAGGGYFPPYFECYTEGQCQAGTHCFNDMGTMRCLPFCSNPGSPCSAGGVCAWNVPTNQGDIHLCMQEDSCNPASGFTGCAFGYSCILFQTFGFPKCYTSPTTMGLGIGVSCSMVDECMAGLTCWSGTCMDVCELSNPSCYPQYPTCTNIGHSTYGVCM